MESRYVFKLMGISNLMPFAVILFTLVSIGISAGCNNDGAELKMIAEPSLTSSKITSHFPTQAPVLGHASKDPLFPLSVTSSSNKEVVFQSPPERIVVFDSAVVEILYAIGEGHRIVGTHDFVEYPPETDDITRVGTAFDMNIEATVALEPDLIVVFSSADVSSLERAGMRVLYLESLGFNFRKVSDNIRLWGRIIGDRESAIAIAEELGLPIRYVGVGEGISDLAPFTPESYVEALFGKPVISAS